MFTCQLPDVNTCIKQLRAKEKKIKIIFKNQNQDNPIQYFLLTKFERRYIFDVFYKSGTDLSALGKGNTDFSVFDNYPDIRHFHNLPLFPEFNNSFQIDVHVTNANLKKLCSLFSLADKLEEIDPQFIAFFQQILDAEIQYRQDTTNVHRFDDLKVTPNLNTSFDDNRQRVAFWFKATRHYDNNNRYGDQILMDYLSGEDPSWRNNRNRG